jgi:hypothetical protein
MADRRADAKAAEAREAAQQEEVVQQGITEAAEGSVLTEEEVTRRIEEARKQEKDKLYKEINELKSSVKDLADIAEAEKSAKEKAEEAAQNVAETERQKALSTEEKLAEQLNKLEERLAMEAGERQALKTELETVERQRQLEAYKAKILSEAGDEIIAELVTGDSIEDIDKNTAIAKAKYGELFQAAFDKAKGEKKDELTSSMPGPTNPDPDAMDEEELSRSLVGTDPEKRAKNQVSEDYLKQRDTLLEQVAQAYRNQA